MRRLALAFALVPALSLGSLSLGCGATMPGDGEEGTGDEMVESTSAALVASDPVSAAIASGCATSVVKGLSTQLVEELQCLRPGTMKSIDKVPGIALGSSAFPFLQTPAADALVAAQKARGTTISVASALRSLPQQFLLYRWYQQGRCGIALAASPGKSNHESGLAVDVSDNAGWRSALEGKGYDWLGAGDPPHFDYVKGGVDIRGLSVRAFQRLWNRNHPEDPIGEDGSYGPETEKRLLRAPIGGFPKGASCTSGDPPAPEDPPDPPNPGLKEPVDDGAPATPATPAEESPETMPQESRGCATAPSGHEGSVLGWLAALSLVAIAVRRRR